jgi:HD-GYP domain-containing protein (c-di-GMP phosphodiesterase class II)
MLDVVVDRAGEESDGVRLAEVVAALCLATDLGMGFPFEHGLEATLMTMRLTELLDVDSDVAAQTFYASLLMYVGCTTDAEESSRIFPGGLTEHLAPVEHGSAGERLIGVSRAVTPPGSSHTRRLYHRARRLPSAARFQKPHYAAVCEVAEMLAERLGLPPSISSLFSKLTERWDGRGVLSRSAGEEIPLPLRIARVARDAAYQRLIHDPEDVVDVIRARAGKALDPDIAGWFAESSEEVFSAVDQPAWEGILSAEPRPWQKLSNDGIDRALTAMGNFADLVSPHLSGHSVGVADLAVRAAEVCGFTPDDVTTVRQAGLVHDLGRVAVHPAVWANKGPLTADEWEQVRLHPYQTERILDQSPFLAGIAAVACCHHERLNGSGYHRRLGASALPPTARLLSTVDAFVAMTEPRAHRARLEPEDAARNLTTETDQGRHDSEIVTAVLEAVGLPPPAIRRPAGLTDREAEVIGLIARGLQTKQVARTLDVSAKTVDNHLQSAYRKIGVSTRAAATLFAMEHGLVS